MTGHVQLDESTITVKGEDLWIDTVKRSGRSDKPVFVENGAGAAYGTSGEFDLLKQTGKLDDVIAGAGDWRIHARQAELAPGKKTKYLRADFTSCDYRPPHYHFHGSSVSLVPKKYLLSYNTLFYLGPVPLFYTPVFYKSLDPDPALKWKFQFGVDHRNGDYVKGTLIARISSTTYAKLFDDWYSKSGFGYGAELDHRSGADSRASLYAYRIHENWTVNDRRALFGAGYQKLGGGYSLQERLQLQSDPAFTNDYVRSDVFRLTPELINSAALTRQFKSGVMRVIYQRDDVQNPSIPNRFVRNTEDTPRVEGQTNSLRIWKLPWLNTFSGFADSNYTRGRDFQQNSLNGTWQGTRSFPITRRISYTPSMTYGETYYNRLDESNFEPPVANSYRRSFQGRWTASNNLRFSSLLGNIDATHLYTKRLKADSLTEDTAPADKGVEQNLLALSDVFVPTSRTWARVATGYDYRTFRDHAPVFDDRVQPIRVDVGWQTRHRLVFTMHDEYQLGPGKGQNRSTIVDFRWGDPVGTSIGGGLSYNLTTPGTYYQGIDLAYSPSTATWRVSIGLWSSVQSPGGFKRAHSGHIFEKEIRWTRRWHDFYTKVIGRIRPGDVRELTFSAELRFGGANPSASSRRDWESEWFPDRSKDGAGLR